MEKFPLAPCRMVTGYDRGSETARLVIAELVKQYAVAKIPMWLKPHPQNHKTVPWGEDGRERPRKRR